MQRYTLMFITINALRVSGGSSAYHQELNKLNKYPMLYVQFWAPDDGRRNRLKHVEHL
jgi:hypothetical protein